MLACGEQAEAGRWSSWVKCEEHEGIKSCVARNVCWDVTSRTLRVFDSSDQDVSFTTYLAAKYPPYSTPEEALVVDGSAGECEGCVFLKGVYGLVGRYFAHNRGHVLGDEVWAMFQALSLWGMEEEYRNMQVILHEDALNADVFEFVNARPVWTVGTVINQHGGFLCMETVVFGLAHLGYALGHSCGDGRSVTCRPKFLPPFQVNVRRFRLLAMELHGISERARPEVAQVVVTRKGRKALNPVRLVNTEEVVAAVKSLGVAVLVADWSTMSSKEQLALMSRTDVLVSLPGSDTMNAIWMPWDRSLVTPCRIYMDGRVDEGNETEIWFRYIHNVTRWCGFDRSRDVERVKGESHMRVPVEVVKALVGEQLGRLSDKGYVLPSVPSGGEGRKP
ncbi:hypothetical protein GUITHDRAFT_121967 [Guillardia theta CCMP2712]|uniref:Glycosyltransferase 61 catalytic domain-containing protein n=1 Tax=Guillardia theta (strain CCMP2712) TaxID=905079 RepID=L1I6I0_GUITC|nr:hypothetical protein GUITHDRAFT_121967 [Guillardia theta CCMP2712]EKX31831.1 hypothetical protein GUITHDRAFT_121967 [Guillardia theta CCMP2712]|eukprot:XP_005818811.1 hypothetical protein GUITHDRAFT_121967 [Guillardia theta CCMP2712]